jgi:heat shock protein HtpX
MLKRVLLFLATNILVITTISIITNMLGLHGYLTAHGIDYTKLAIFCAIWGTAGAFISLLLSKFIAKMSQGITLIDPQRATGNEQALLQMVYQLARKAGLNTMPEVGYYHSPELNAFATGPSRSNSLIAVSTGLLTKMNRNEIEGVLAHEVSHVANGDMVTMTLIQGVVNAFSLFLSRIIAYAISTALARGQQENGNGHSMLVYSMLTMVFDILFTLLGSMVVATFSRWREYRADAGGAKLAGRNNMIAALQQLRNTVELEDDRAPAMAAFKISHRPSLLDIFSSHPPLAKRIERLMQTT